MNKYYLITDDEEVYRVPANWICNIEIGADGELLLTTEDDFVYAATKIELISD